MKKNLYFGLLVLLFFGCRSNPGTTTVGNPSPSGNTSQLVTFSRVNNGTSSVSIPLAVFGSNASALSNATVDLQKEGGAITRVSAQSQFDTSTQRVIIPISSANPGNTVAVVVNRSASSSSIYASTLGSSDRTRASLDCDRTTNSAEQLACSVCRKTSSCETSLSLNRCLSNIISSTQVDIVDEFGVPVPENSVSFQTVVEAVENGILSPNTTRLSRCLTDLGGLTCDIVSTGYSASDPDNFNNLENIVPEDENSCPRVYSDNVLVEPLTATHRESSNPSGLTQLDLNAYLGFPSEVTLSTSDIQRLLVGRMSIVEFLWKNVDRGYGIGIGNGSSSVYFEEGLSIDCSYDTSVKSFNLLNSLFTTSDQTLRTSFRVGMVRWDCPLSLGNSLRTYFGEDVVLSSTMDLTRAFQTYQGSIDLLHGAEMVSPGHEVFYSNLYQQIQYRLDPESHIEFLSGGRMVLSILPQLNIMETTTHQRGAFGVSGLREPIEAEGRYSIQSDGNLLFSFDRNYGEDHEFFEFPNSCFLRPSKFNF